MGAFKACAVAEGCGVLGLSFFSFFFCDETSSFAASDCVSGGLELLALLRDLSLSRAQHMVQI